MKNLISKYSIFVIKNPLKILSAVLLVILIASQGISNFKLDASADTLILDDDKDLKLFREINDRYESNEFLILSATSLSLRLALHWKCVLLHSAVIFVPNLILMKARFDLICHFSIVKDSAAAAAAKKNLGGSKIFLTKCSSMFYFYNGHSKVELDTQ